jgi:hypothetical protein
VSRIGTGKLGRAAARRSRRRSSSRRSNTERPTATRRASPFACEIAPGIERSRATPRVCKQVRLEPALENAVEVHATGRARGRAGASASRSGRSRSRVQRYGASGFRADFLPTCSIAFRRRTRRTTRRYRRARARAHDREAAGRPARRHGSRRAAWAEGKGAADRRVRAAAHAARDTWRTAEQRTSSERSAASARLRTPRNALRVLVVEDEPDARRAGGPRCSPKVGLPGRDGGLVRRRAGRRGAAEPPHVLISDIGVAGTRTAMR